jgi:hypothetical protein
MAYDDDDKLNFRDFEDWAVLIERFLSAPENLTVIRLLALTQAVHTISSGRDPGKVSMQELAHGLRQRGLANVPFDTVVRLTEAVGRIPAEKDALAEVTLRDVQRIVR